VRVLFYNHLCLPPLRPPYVGVNDRVASRARKNNSWIHKSGCGPISVLFWRVTYHGNLCSLTEHPQIGIWSPPVLVSSSLMWMEYVLHSFCDSHFPGGGGGVWKNKEKTFLLSPNISLSLDFYFSLQIIRESMLFICMYRNRYKQMLIFRIPKSRCGSLKDTNLRKLVIFLFWCKYPNGKKTGSCLNWGRYPRQAMGPNFSDSHFSGHEKTTFRRSI